MGEDVLKTKSSFRTLPLIPAVGIILLEEKEKQEMYRRLFKKSYCRDYLDYICVDQCGKLLRPNYVTEHFSWLIEKYGLRKVRFHDLRHALSLIHICGMVMSLPPGTLISPSMDFCMSSGYFSSNSVSLFSILLISVADSFSHSYSSSLKESATEISNIENKLTELEEKYPEIMQKSMDGDMSVPGGSDMTMPQMCIRDRA